jgi:hypothetical protein
MAINIAIASGYGYNYRYSFGLWLYKWSTWSVGRVEGVLCASEWQGGCCEIGRGVSHPTVKVSERERERERVRRRGIEKSPPG